MLRWHHRGNPPLPEMREWTEDMPLYPHPEQVVLSVLV